MLFFSLVSPLLAGQTVSGNSSPTPIVLRDGKDARVIQSNIVQLGPGGGGYLTSIVIDPENSRTLYVSGDNCGVYKSLDGGQSWRAMNNGLVNYRVGGLAMHPKDNQILFAATQGGVFKSTNGGNSWNSKRKGFPDFTQDFYKAQHDDLTTVAVNPYRPNIIFSGCGGSARFRPRDRLVFAGYMSNDGGEVWAPLANGTGGPDPSKPLVITSFAFQKDSSVWMGSNQGLFKSADGGRNWQRIGSQEIKEDFIMEVEIIAEDFSKIFVATREDNDKGSLYVSGDGGKSWGKVNPKGSLYDMPCGFFKILSRDGKTIWATFGSRMCQSIDGGRTWKILGKPDNPGYTNYSGRKNDSTVFAFDISPHDQRTIYTIFNGVLKSSDAGETWEALYTKGLKGKWSNRGFVNTVTQDIFVDPKDNNKVMVGELDAGLSVSGDGGESWRNLHPFFRRLTGELSKDCYDITKDPSGDYFALVGNFSNRFSWLVSSKDGIAWKPVRRFNGAYSKLDIIQTTLGKRYFALVPGEGVFCTDNLRDWTLVEVGNRYPRSIIQDPVKPDLLYLGFSYEWKEGKGGLFKSHDGGKKWQQVKSDNLIDVWSIGMKPGDSSMIFVGTRGYRQTGTGGVFLSRDGGSTWERMDKLIPIEYEDPKEQAKRWARSLSYSKDGKVLYAGFTDQGYDYNQDKGVFYSLDDGLTWKKVTGLPVNDVKVVRVDPTINSRIWIGTEGSGAHRIDIAITNE